MKREVTVGPSLAESHLTILQAVSAKQQTVARPEPGEAQISYHPALPRPCPPRRWLPRSLVCWQTAESRAFTPKRLLLQPQSHARSTRFSGIGPLGWFHHRP